MGYQKHPVIILQNRIVSRSHVRHPVKPAVSTGNHKAHSVIVIMQICQLTSVIIIKRSGNVPASPDSDIIITFQRTIGYKKIVIICLRQVDHIGTFEGTVCPGRAPCQTGPDSVFGGKPCGLVQKKNVAAAPEGAVQQILLSGACILDDVGINPVHGQRIACL